MRTSVAMLERVATTIERNSEMLSSLDAQIGDGDHGYSMATGMRAVADALSKTEPQTLADVFGAAALQLMKAIGGASGAVFGAFFLGLKAFAETELADPSRATIAELVLMYQRGFDKVTAQGKAELGQKTMLDSLYPAIEAFRSVAQHPSTTISTAYEAAAAAAQRGADNTANMVAKRGRAKHLGETTLGHIDPGAKTMSLMWRAMSEILT